MKLEFSALALMIFTLSLKSYGDDVTNAISKQSPKGIFFSQREIGDPNETRDHLSLIALGDVLLHKPLHVQALKSSEGHISLWKNLEGLIKSADMAYANLEGPVAPGIGRSGNPTHDPGKIFDDSVYTGYPRFNYHEELIEDLVTSGFDVVSTANNHALDRGSLGIDKTIEILNKNHLAFTGTKTQQEANSGQREWYTIVEKNGFRIAWIACTFSTNGLPDRHSQVLNCFKQNGTIVNTIKTVSFR